MSIANLFFNVLKVVFSTCDYNLDIVMTDKNGVVIHERHVTLDQYTDFNVWRLKREIDELGESP